MLERHASVSQPVPPQNRGAAPFRESCSHNPVAAWISSALFLYYSGENTLHSLSATIQNPRTKRPHMRGSTHPPYLSSASCQRSSKVAFSIPVAFFESRRLTFAATGIHGTTTSQLVKYSLGIGRRLTQHNTGLQVSPWRRLCPTPKTLAPLAPAPGPLHAMPPHTQLATYLAPC